MGPRHHTLNTGKLDIGPPRASGEQHETETDEYKDALDDRHTLLEHELVGQDPQLRGYRIDLLVVLETLFLEFEGNGSPDLIVL